MVGAAGLFAFLVDLALAAQYQGVHGLATGEAQRARLIRWQTAADDLLPGNQSPVGRRQGSDER